MARLTKIVCDACGEEIFVDEMDADIAIVGIELYCECNKKVKALFDGGGVKELCDDCALKIAKCYNDIITKSSKNNA